WIRDLVLDLLRRPPHPVSEDDHLVVREIGDRIDGRGEQCPVSPAAHQQKEGDHQEAVPERQLDQPVDHRAGLSQGYAAVNHRTVPSSAEGVALFTSRPRDELAPNAPSGERTDYGARRKGREASEESRAAGARPARARGMVDPPPWPT